MGIQYNQQKVVVRFSSDAYKNNKAYFAYLGRIVAQEFDDEKLTMTFYTFADYSRDDIATIIADEMAFVESDKYEIMDIAQDYEMVDFNSLQRDVIGVGVHRSKRTNELRSHYATLVFGLRNKEIVCAMHRETSTYIYAYVHQKYSDGSIAVKSCSQLRSSLTKNGAKAYENCEKTIIDNKNYELFPMQKMFLPYSVDSRIEGVRALYFNYDLSSSMAKNLAFSTLGKSIDKYTVAPPVQYTVLLFAQNYGCPTPDRGYKFFVKRNSCLALELQIVKPENGIHYLPMGITMMENMLEYRLILPTSLVRIMEKAILAIQSWQEIEITA